MAVITGSPAVAIPNGTSISSAFQLNGGHVEGIYVAGWTAAGMSFEVSEDGSVFVPLVDALGVEMTLTVVANRAIAVPLAALRGWNWLRVRSGTSAVPVNQGADRLLTFITRRYS